MSVAIFRRIQSIDESVVRSVYGIVPPRIALVVTHLGTYGGIWLVSAIALLAFGSPPSRGVGARTLAAVVSSILINIVVKRLVHRDRPAKRLELHLHDRLIRATSASFPSLHALGSFACAYVLADGFRAFAIPAFVVASAVGASRVVLGAHYPSDVLAGAALGIGLGTAIDHVALFG